MNFFLIIVTFFLGLIFGSFLSVLFHRLEVDQAEAGQLNPKRGKKAELRKLMGGRSRCDHCETQIAWYDNLPLVSYLALKGRCRHCGKHISIYHPLLELATALYFSALVLLVGFGPAFFTGAVFGLVLLFLFAYDVRYQVIPNVVVLPAIGWALAVILVQAIMNAIHPPGVHTIQFLLLPISPVDALIGGALVGGFFLAMFLLSKGAWIGGGDVKLGVLIGLLLGWPYALVGLMAAYLIGSAYAVALLVGRHAELKTMVAFGPMLVAGWLITLFYGPQLLNWYNGINI